MPKSRRSLANSIRIVLAPLLLGLFGAFSGFATDGIYSKFGLDLGYAGRIGYPGPEWAIYVYGAGTASSRFNALNISSPPDATGLQVDGNIALAGVYSTLTVSGHTSINGDRYEQMTSTESIKSNGTITGSRFSSATINSQLNSGVTSLENVSIMAAGLTATAGSPTSLNIGKNQSKTFDITSPAFSGKYVMNLSSFVMGGGTNGANGGTLTLKGAAGSAFVINVSGAFSLGSNARIVLAGGLTVSDVLFNVTGSNSTFSIGGDALFNGTLLAYNSSGAQRTLQITGHNTQINGELIANKINLQSGAHVKKPKEKSKEKDDDALVSNSTLRERIQ